MHNGSAPRARAKYSSYITVESLLSSLLSGWALLTVKYSYIFSPVFFPLLPNTTLAQPGFDPWVGMNRHLV